jgi:tRNA nucleotidyltransferase (CCA-adding enzyme)
MAMDVRRDIKDFFNGIEDLKEGVIRCVSVSSERFKEDRLRILRVFCFASRLHFKIDWDILAVIKDDPDISNRRRSHMLAHVATSEERA